MTTGVSQLNTSVTHEINAHASDCVIGYGHELIHGICCNVNIDTDSTLCLVNYYSDPIR